MIVMEYQHGWHDRGRLAKQQGHRLADDCKTFRPFAPCPSPVITILATVIGKFISIYIAIAIAIAIGFAVFYAYRLVRQATEKQLKALSTFGVLLLWAGATYALGFSFVFDAFGMGHNAPAPLKDQLMIAGTLAGFVVGYGVLGYLMYLFVREPKRNTVQ